MYYGWVIVAAGITAYSVLMGGIYSSFGLFILPISEEYGLSRAEANTGLVLLSLGIALQGTFIGRMLDRMSVRRVMLIGAAVFGLSLIAIALSPSIWITSAVLGLALPFATQAACSLAVPVLIVRWFSQKTARAMVITQVGLSLGGIAVPPLAAMLIESLGWRSALLVQGICAGILLAIVALVVRDRPDPANRHPETVPAPASHTKENGSQLSISQLLRSPPFWTINLSAAFVVATSSAFSISLAPLASGEGLSLTEAATVVSVSSAGGMVGKVILALFGDRYDKSRLLATVYVASAVSTGALLMPGGYWWMIAAVAPLGMVSGANSALLASFLADKFGRASYGTVTGLTQPIQSIASILAFRYAGEVFDRTGNYDLFLMTIIAVNTIAAIMMLATRFIPSPTEMGSPTSPH